MNIIVVDTDNDDVLLTYLFVSIHVATIKIFIMNEQW